MAMVLWMLATEATLLLLLFFVVFAVLLGGGITLVAVGAKGLAYNVLRADASAANVVPAAGLHMCIAGGALMIASFAGVSVALCKREIALRRIRDKWALIPSDDDRDRALHLHLAWINSLVQGVALAARIAAAVAVAGFDNDLGARGQTDAARALEAAAGDAWSACCTHSTRSDRCAFFDDLRHAGRGMCDMQQQESVEAVRSLVSGDLSHQVSLLTAFACVQGVGWLLWCLRGCCMCMSGCFMAQ